MTIRTTYREVPGEGMVEVRRSSRRHRTVTMVRRNGQLVLMLPARMSRKQEDIYLERLLVKVRASEKKERASSVELAERADELAATYLPEGVRASSVRWVSNMSSRWASCTSLDGSIRVSDELKGVPGWVLDYVLVHELAHLVVPGHDKEFWAIVNQYPKTERARGFLSGMQFASSREASG